MTDDLLVVDSLVVRFGGVTALDGLSLRVPAGRLVGLIGPNGAGKTTMFNACSGLVKPHAGSIFLKGEDITRASPASRARLGLGRTFQRMELYDRLTVTENVEMGREARITASRVLGTIYGSAADRRTVRNATSSALERCGISHLRDRRAGALATGERRLVELARAFAGGFEMLLLDEPSSGIDASETESIGHILRDVVADDRIGILLVEHDMSLVRSVCNFVYVLDFGQLIAHGPTDDALATPEVRAAYLGLDVA
jgi:ABC-type branched-subunit amino acid transport system ATPase component